MEFATDKLRKQEALLQDIDEQSSSNSGSSKTRCPGGSEVDGGEIESGWSLASSPEAVLGTSQAGRPRDKDESSREDPSEGGSSEECGAGPAACALVQGAEKEASYHCVDESASGQDRGRYPSLERDGPSRSQGSAGHPDGCKPCAFYCYSLCGCRNGPDCIFCHLSHESKLRQRREEWKRSQREKRGMRRKAAREEAANFTTGFVQDVLVPSSTDNSIPFELGGFAGRLEPMRIGEVKGAAALSGLQCFPYTPTDAMLAVGSFVRLVPPPEMLVDMPRIFSVLPELPKGLHLDPYTGVIHGVAWEPLADMTTFLVTSRRSELDDTADVLQSVARFQVVNRGSSPTGTSLHSMSINGSPEEVTLQPRERVHAGAGANLDISWSPLQRPGALMMKTAMDAEHDFADANFLAGLRWH